MADLKAHAGVSSSITHDASYSVSTRTGTGTGGSMTGGFGGGADPWYQEPLNMGSGASPWYQEPLNMGSGAEPWYQDPLNMGSGAAQWYTEPLNMGSASSAVKIYPTGGGYPRHYTDKLLSVGDQIFVYKNIYTEIEGKPEVPEIKTILNDGEWSNGAVSKRSLGVHEFFYAKPKPNPKGIRIGLGKKSIKFNTSNPESVFFVTIVGDEISYEGSVVYQGNYNNFEIVRYQNLVTVEVDSVIVASKPLPSFETVHVYAQLYGIDDYIDEAKIEAHQVPEEDIYDDIEDGESYQGYISTFRLQSFIDGDIVVYGGDQQSGNYCALYAVNSVSIAENNNIKGKGFIPSFAVDGRITEITDGSAMLSKFMPSFKLSSLMLSGGIIQTPEDAEVASAFIGKAFETDFLGGEFSVIQGAMLQAYAHTPDDSDITFYENLNCGAPFLGNHISILAFAENIEATSSIDVSIITNFAIYEALTLQSDFSFNSIIELLIKEAVSFKDNSKQIEEVSTDALQYAVNSISGAISRYSNFEFIDYAYIGNKTYAINKTGLFAIGDEDTDNGSNITASIDFGTTDYGTRQGKIISSIYAGISTDGQVYFRLIDASGRESVYLATDYGTELRAKTAKGLISNMWRIKLEVVDATAIDLDNFEVELGVSQRRLRR